MSTEEVGIRLSLKDRVKVARGLKDTDSELEQVADSARDMGDAGREAARGLDKASDRRFARGLAAIGRGARGVAGFLGRGLVTATKAGVVGLAALSVGAAGVSAHAIGLASDARETASAFNTVFGPAADTVGGRLDKLTKKFGIYNPELQDAARTFGVFAKAAGIPQKNLANFSTSLTKAGLDLASFYNTEPGEALDALRSGLAGEAEPLRKFGIFLSDASMKAEAASMGLTGTLTEQQKVMVRQRIIMKGLGDAQGDMARTSQGFANQQRAAQGRAKQFLSMLGGPLTTAATGAFRGVNAVLKAGIRELKREMPGLEKGAQGLSRTFARWGRQMARQLPGAIDRAKAKIGALRTGWQKFTGSADGATLRDLGRNIRRLGPAISAAAAEAPGLSDVLVVTNTVAGFFAQHADTLAKLMPVLAAGFVAVKVAQLAANVASVVGVGVRLAEVVATRQHTAAMVAQTAALASTTVATGASTVATGAQTAATGGATVAQRGLNLAIMSSPLFWIIGGIMLLVGAFILAYKKVDWFRTIVDWLWNKALKPVASFLVDVFVANLKFAGEIFTWIYDNALKPVGRFISGPLLRFLARLGTGYLRMAQWGLKAFRWLLKAAFQAFDGILSAAEKGLGWVPGMGNKISRARKAFDNFGNATISKLDKLSGKLKQAEQAADNLARDRKATVSIAVNYSGLQGDPTRGRPGSNIPGMANGGPVQAGRTYIVGEQRPELFVPDTNGRIVPRPTTSDLRAAASPRPWSADEVDRRLFDPKSRITVGRTGPSGPLVVKVMLKGKEIAEAVLDDVDARVARK